MFPKNEDKEIVRGKPRFSEEFKIDSIKQITERGHSVVDISQRLGVSTHSLYGWIKRYFVPSGSVGKDGQISQIRRLTQELVRVTEERDILKGNGLLRQKCKMKCAFIKEHCPQFTVRIMCRMMCVHPLDSNFPPRDSKHEAFCQVVRTLKKSRGHPKRAMMKLTVASSQLVKSTASYVRNSNSAKTSRLHPTHSLH